MHAPHPFVALRCLHSSHHPQPCLALAPFCCDNMQCRIHENWCTIVYCGQIIVCSQKCTQTGLWMTPLTPWSTTVPTALSATNLPSVAMAANDSATSSSAEYARYVHQLLCSPPAFTLLHTLATSTKLTTIPGLTGIDLFPSPTLHGHWQRPYALPPLKHCINTQQSC